MGVPFDFTAVFGILGTGDYTLTRRVPGAVNETTGLIPAPTETAASLTGVIVQPEKSLADDELRLRGGASSSDRLKVWVPTAQLSGNGGAITCSTSSRLADRIVYRGNVYEATDSLDHTETAAYSFARFGIVDTSFEGTVGTATEKHIALVAWVRSALAEIPGLKVVWGYQAGLPYQAPPAVVLWFAKTPAAERGIETFAYNGSADPGEEYQHTVSRHWLTMLGVGISCANGAQASHVGADAMARDLLTDLRHPDTQAALVAAGLGLVDETDIDLDPPALFQNTWQPQALFGVRFNMTTSKTRTAGYFDTAELAAEVDGNDLGSVTFPLEATP